MVLRFHRTGTVEITMVTVTKIIIDQPPVLTVTAETKCCVAVSSIRGSTALESRWISMATIGQVLSYTGLKNMMPLQWNPGQSFLMPAKPDIATLWSSQVFCDSNIIQPDPAGPKRWTCPSKSSKSATKKKGKVNNLYLVMDKKTLILAEWMIIYIWCMKKTFTWVSTCS